MFTLQQAQINSAEMKNGRWRCNGCQVERWGPGVYVRHLLFCSATCGAAHFEKKSEAAELKPIPLDEAMLTIDLVPGPMKLVATKDED